VFSNDRERTSRPDSRARFLDSSGKLGSEVRLDRVRLAFMRAERAKGKSRRDSMIIAQGKRSAALGKEPDMNTSLFFESCFSGLPARKTKTRKKGEVGVWRP
jgi:hypothetical protein